MIINPFALEASIPLLLDTYSGALSGYSIARKLKAVNTKCCSVQRSSDSAIQDIGFSGNQLASASLLTFTGAGNGTVLRLYDQTDDTNYAGGGGSLVVSGSLGTLGTNGRPAITLSANVNDIFSSNDANWGTTKGLGGNAAWTAFMVYRKTVNTAGCPFGFGDNTVSLQAAGYYDDGAAAVVGWSGGNNFITSVPANNTHYLLTITKAAGAINTTTACYRNGVSVATTGHSTATPSVLGNRQLQLGRWSALSSNKLQGQLQEMVIFAGDKSSDRAGIEANINAFYGIY